MRPVPPAAALLCLLPVLLSRSEASSGELPETVPLPTNVVIESLNFKTVLRWDYMRMPTTPRFIVEIQPYELGKYEPVSTCMKTSKHYCDLSNEIEDLSQSYWAKVKALIGLEESEYVETKEFVLRRDGKIGPPTLNVSIERDQIRVEIRPPRAVRKYKDFTYKVFLWSNGEQIEELEAGPCKKHPCSIYIPFFSSDSTYCVSAQGRSSIVTDRGFSQSNQSCIHVPLKQPRDFKNIIISVAVVIGVGLILAMYYVCKQLKKRKIELPKSLVTVIRNLNSRNVLETKPEAKCISVITSSSSKSTLSGSDEVNLIDQVDQVKEIGTPNPEDCSEETDTVSSQEISNKTEEMSIQESIAEMTPDDEESPRVKENYFHSNSSQTELSSIPSEPEPSNTEVQESLILKSCNKFSGYDKPHVLMDLLIDVGEEESVIAYRHTDEVHES
ncbi:interferon gamma receptor 1 [Terrapene carolina triunguis]|uniref:Interferon gamma receptor 1 n=1 Tax=Terrapene triunguis TaxID=2587831 RepID=A0A674I091_9SAUR|nr:interferon gamma receptor 1 [Terrapene carolina triunguis]